MSWVHSRPGLYVRDEKALNDKIWLRAIVMQDGELWISRVYVDGDEVDRGEWDGRSVALRNARGAMKRAVANRSTGHIERIEREEEENDEL